MHTCVQKVPLVKKLGKPYAQKGVKLEIANFRILVLVNSCISLTGAPTNMKVGREMKLCDPTNIVMVKGMQTFLENKQPQAKGTCMCM